MARIRHQLKDRLPRAEQFPHFVRWSMSRCDSACASRVCRFQLRAARRLRGPACATSCSKDLPLAFGGRSSAARCRSIRPRPCLPYIRAGPGWGKRRVGPIVNRSYSPGCVKPSRAGSSSALAFSSAISCNSFNRFSVVLSLHPSLPQSRQPLAELSVGEGDSGAYPGFLNFRKSS